MASPTASRLPRARIPGHTRTLLVTSAVAVLSLGLSTLGQLPAHSDPATGPAPLTLQELAPGIRDSARLTGDVVVAGTALSNAGEPVAAGTPVVLQAWPPSRVLAPLAVGESVKLSPVGGAVTRVDGSFDLRFSDPALLIPYVNETGLVDLEVTMTIDGVPSVQALSYPAPADIATAVGVPAENLAELERAGARSTKAVQLTRDGGLATTDDDDGGDASGLADSTPGLDAAARTSGDGNSDVADKTCVSTKIANLGSRQTIVGRAYTVAGAKATLTFTTGASTELGIGFSATGTNGSFKANGTSSIQTESVTVFPSSAGISGRIWKTDFHFAKFRIICTTGSNAQTMYEVRATAHDGGAQASIPTGPPTVKSINCKKYNSGSNFTKSTTKATGFSGGVEISSAIGIDLSAKTGYSKKAAVKFAFSKALRLCGTKGLPADSPGTLVAKEL